MMDRDQTMDRNQRMERGEMADRDGRVDRDGRREDGLGVPGDRGTTRLAAGLRRVALVACCSTPVLAPVHASSQTLATDDPVLHRIWVEATERSEIEPLAQVLLDELGPRLTASPQMERAQAWAVETLEGWGVDARLEEYGTWEGWDRGPSHVDLISPRVRSLEGRILAWSPGTGGAPVEGGVTYPEGIRSPADWDAFLETVAGTWVMLSFPQPTCRTDEQWAEYGLPGSAVAMDAAREAAEEAWERNLANAGSEDVRGRDLHAQIEEAGALGIITSIWPGSYGTTRVFNAYNRATPTFELGCEDYGLVYRLAANGQAPVVRLTAEAENLGEIPVFNVIGEIRGTERPDEYVVLSAHYDSWEGASGATDNGSGSVLMLETMRILRAAYPEPRRTILIGLWSGEEQGLNGSRAFTEDHPEVVDGLQALWNQDNGTGRVVRLSAQGLVGATPFLASWMSKVPEEVARHVELQLPGSPGGGGSDYASFVCYGAPAFSLSALSWDYGSHTWHTHRDTFDKLVFDDLRNNAVLTASLAYLAADDPAFVDRTRREVLVGRGGQPVQWPECRPAVRRSTDSSRMQ
ncbi:MAG: M20/M25/M40 family metallo-hydrolase [Longimicrobiales bacterium]|nr:M20/M25/M40 family metallo-hydrolase [Longimicrobiales bacterium]